MTFVEGTIKRYLFFSEENSYSVIKIGIEDTNEPELTHYEPTIIVCGFFPKLEVGSRYRFSGQIKHHNVYGLQYDARSFEQIIDTTKEGIIDYISGNIFPGIGIKTANRVVETLGLDCLDLIADTKDVLNKVPKLSKKQKDVLHESIINNRQMENTLVWLYGFSISPNMAMRIYSKYGLESKMIIKENPYILMEEVEGIGFKRADEIALKVGFAFDSDIRVSAVIYYLLNEYMNKYGDTFLLKEDLIAYTLQFLNSREEFVVEEFKVISQLSFLIEKGKLIQTQDKISLSYLFYAEKFIAKKIMILNQAKELTQDIDTHILAFQEMNKISYTDAQKKAIKLALSNYLSIITGGPGTGKTTVIKGIIDVYKASRPNEILNEEIRLAAPTGKAAKRLSESTDLPATTIHKLLGFDYEGQYKYGENNPIEAKLLIIDEASMIDCLLMRKLIGAIKVGTTVVLVGDANQLPSVGPGDILNDLISSDLIPLQRLNIIHRQAKDSHIVSLAYNVLEKQVHKDMIENTDDRVFIFTKDNFIAVKVMKSIEKLMTKGYDLIEDIQVLIPMYKGQNGIDRMNDLIQETFNGDNKDYSITFGNKKFYYQDKVMQLVNQPDKNIMNGDQGIVSAIDDGKELLVNFSGNIVKYDKKDLDQLTLAYAVSIHKSQGSEYKVVLLPLTMAYTIMLKKKLLYTAITRAKEMLIMIGDFKAFRRGVLGNDRQRNTMLQDFLVNEISSSSMNHMKIEDFL